jgi:hypothetical protein
MPPDTAERRPRAESGAHDDDHDVSTKIQAGAASGRRCGHCGGPLAPKRRRFCSDLCRIRGQRAERKTDDADHAEYVKRLVEAQGKRAGADLPMFALFAEAVDFARARLQDAADQLIAQGHSYSQIGAALGITRQAA